MTSRRDSRTKRWLLSGALLGATVVLAVIGRMTTSPEPDLRTGDKEAAQTADFLIPGMSEATADVTESERPRAAEQWLLQPDDRYRHAYTYWAVGVRKGERIPVTLYTWWEDRSFSQYFWGGPYWGRSCQVFTVTPDLITAKSVKCPASTPEQPSTGRR